MQPPVGVERVRGLLGIVEVAAEHVAAAAQHLAVLAEHDVAARDRWADRSRHDPERCPGHRAGRLGEPVDLRQLDAERAEETQHLDGEGRGAADRRHDLVETQQLTNRPQHGRLGRVDPRGSVGRRSLAPGPVRSGLASRFERAPEVLLAAGSIATTACTPAYTFSQTRGTPKTIWGRTSGKYCATAPASGHVVTSYPNAMPW